MYKSINSKVFKSLHLSACCCTWPFDRKQIIPFISRDSSFGQIRSSNLVIEAKTVVYAPSSWNSTCKSEVQFPGNFSCNIRLLSRQ